MSQGEAVAMQPAGFWRRLAALVVDTWMLSVATRVIDIGWGVANQAHLVGNGPSDTLSGTTQLVLVAAYFTVCWGWRGQTVGYVLLQIRLSRQDGGRVGYGRALLRYVLLGLSFVLCFIPALVSLILVALPARKRALHDLLTSTRVVRLRPEAVAPPATLEAAPGIPGR
ncbi:MAG: RDD family protein [Candidatus Dormibacteraceae bacterium]